MQGLDREIFERFGIETKSVLNYKDGYLVNTSKGRKVARKMLFSPERLVFVHGAKEHLVTNGFANVDRYVCTLDGKPSFFYNNVHYSLTEYIEGRECILDNDRDVYEASKILATLHASSKGYKPPEGSKAQSELGKLPEYFNKRIEDIKRLKKLARKGSGVFDRMFLDNAAYFISIGEDALNCLKESQYCRLVENCKKTGSFCHHDYTHYNIIFGERANSVINFENCCFELSIYDLTNFIRRRMRKCNWDMDKAKIIIDGYTSVKDISKPEQEVMRIMLQFPQKFWRVVNKYYNSRRSWSERSCLSKLTDVVEEIPVHGRFIERYNSLWR
jgi:spore coat protein I